MVCLGNTTLTFDLLSILYNKFKERKKEERKKYHFQNAILLILFQSKYEVFLFCSFISHIFEADVLL